MHDLVPEMALWLTCDIEKQQERCVVQAGLGLPEVPRVKDWSIVRKMSLMNNEIQEISSNGLIVKYLLIKNRNKPCKVEVTVDVKREETELLFSIIHRRIQ